MKLPKKIKEMPWPEDFHGNNEHFHITIARPVIEHERFMVITFMVNREKPLYHYRREGDACNFRLICSKKRKRARLIYQGNKTVKRHRLNIPLNQACTNSYSCYPLISEADETAIKKWLGEKNTWNHYIEHLDSWVESAIKAEIQSERDARGEIRDEDVELCPTELPTGIIEWVRNEILPKDRALLYKRGNVRGVCFQCSQKVRANPNDKFKQGQLVLCPNCGSQMIACLEDSDTFDANYVGNIATLQKGKDGKTVFVRQWHILRDKTAQWNSIPLEEIARYAIRGNKVAKWQREAKENHYFRRERYQLKDWYRCKDISRVYDGSYQFYRGAMEEVLENTSLAYCNPVEYLDDAKRDRGYSNIIRFLLDWARYPAVEKLWKAGYRNLIHQKVFGIDKSDRYAINWNKATIQEAMRFPIRYLKQRKADKWDMHQVRKMSEYWKLIQSKRIKEQDIEILEKGNIDLNNLENAFGRASVYKIVSYIEKQLILNESSQSIISRTYRDYLSECIMLNLNLDDKAVLFPKNLEEAHNRTMAMINFEKNKVEKEKFAKAVAKLEKYSWEHNGLIIRPAREQEELAFEGAELHHCVGGYIKRMANSETAIFFVRRIDQPEVPFYTLELEDRRIVQCRTKNNAGYAQDERVKAFVDSWFETIVKTGGKKKRKKKVHKEECVA